MKNDNLNLEDILIDKHEDELIEIPLAEAVFKTSIFVIVLVVLAITWKLFSIGILNHVFYERSAFTNMTQAKVLVAPRGVINDRFGKVITGNEAASRIYLSPNKLPDSIREKLEVFRKIEETLGLQSGELDQLIENHDWRLGRLLLEGDPSHDELVHFSSGDFPGIDIEPGFQRVHVDSRAFSHVVGYTGLVDRFDMDKDPMLSFEDEIGKSGLEFYYDDKLRGINGQKIIVLNAKGEVQEERILREPEAGDDIDTYIDAELQKYFYDTLKSQIKSVGSHSGAGLAINPENGEVLAMVSIPGFESGRIVDYLNQPHEPLFNRVIGGLYSPGSTIKPLVGIAALTEGVITPLKQLFSSGYLSLPNPYNPDNPSIFMDWKPHGWVDLYSAIARSSNVYFYTVGGGFELQKGLGISKLQEWWGKFRLNKKTFIDLPGETSGFLPSPDWKEENLGEIWRIGDTYNVSIGQGDLLMSPLELLSYIGAIANGGRFYKLRVAQEEEPVILSNLTKEIESAVDDVLRGMVDVTQKSYGTAYMLSDLPMKVAAKTGSAEVANKKKINAFFVGFAPAENPEIAILVLIEDAREGGMNTVPVARDVLMWYQQNRMVE